MYSRKYSIMIAVVIFTVGSALQTASVDYAMLVTARLIGGVGIGMYVPRVFVLSLPPFYALVLTSEGPG